MKSFEFNEMHHEFENDKSLAELVKAVVNRINIIWEDHIMYDLENGDVPHTYEIEDAIRMLKFLKRITCE